MLKKFLMAGVVGYSLYKVSAKILSQIPSTLVMEAGVNSVDKPLPKFIRKLVMKYPYSGFCEITGCRVEIHATTQSSFHGAMSHHLQNGHPDG